MFCREMTTKEEWKDGMMEEWNTGIVERLSKLVCENLIACPELDSGSGLWEGLWERIIMERWKSKEVEESKCRKVKGAKVCFVPDETTVILVKIGCVFKS